jgi:hypothetical protein
MWRAGKALPVEPAMMRRNIAIGIVRKSNLLSGGATTGIIASG